MFSYWSEEPTFHTRKLAGTTSGIIAFPSMVTILAPAWKATPASSLARMARRELFAQTSLRTIITRSVLAVVRAFTVGKRGDFSQKIFEWQLNMASQKEALSQTGPSATKSWHHITIEPNGKLASPATVMPMVSRDPANADIPCLPRQTIPNAKYSPMPRKDWDGILFQSRF